jgi:hypothetical protein
VSDDPRRVTTVEERDRFNAAKEHGGLCAVCGKTLADDETVYIEQMAIDLNAFAPSGAQWSRKAVYRDAPLGVECASPGFLARTKGREPERCEHCGRSVYYAKERAGRQRAVCSRRCSHRAGKVVRSPMREGSR